jgi:hypothetical protein
LGESSERIAPKLGRAVGLSAAVFTSNRLQHCVTRNIVKEFTGVEYYLGLGGWNKKANSIK